MGVFIGTIISTFILFFYSYPKYVYKFVLEGKYQEYIKLHFVHGIITTLICFVTGFISSWIRVENVYLQLILNGMLCLVVPNALYLLFATRRPEFGFYREKLKNILAKARN